MEAKPLSLVRADAVAARLNMPRQSVWRMARRGELPVIRIGREMRFDLLDVEDFIARRKSPRTQGR